MYNRYFSLLGATLALTLILSSCGKDRPKPDFTVTFDSRGGSAVSSQTVAEGDTVVRPADPTREGYTFAGWSTDSATTMLYDFSTPVTGDLTLYALWNINTFRITFDSRGGSALSSRTVTQDSMATRPPDPTREGYVFAGWSTDSVTTILYDFSTPVTADLTLYALWIGEGINTFTITFDSRGGNDGSSQIVAEDGTVFRPTDPARRGYTFAGWSTDSVTTMLYDFSTPVTADLTLYARWDVNTFTITFDTQGGSVVSVQTVTTDNRVSRPTNPTRQGYVFAGWSTEPATTILYDFSTPVTGDLTLYALWISEQINTFTITFDSRGGNEVSSRTVAENDTVFRPTNPTRQGYTFEGWSTDSATTILYDFSTSVTADLMLYARWIAVFTITFDSRGGSAVSSRTVMQDSMVSRPTAPTREGYTFEGWYTDSATTMPYDFSTSVTADLMLYARWIAVFTITFDSRGGSAVSSRTVMQDSMVSRPTAPTREGYTFEGWYTDSATTMPYDFSTSVTADLMLYARWIAVFTITFDSRGGSAVSSRTVMQDSMVSRPTAPTREGYTFEGWYTDSATTMPYDFNTAVTADLTLYARWREPLVAIPDASFRAELKRIIPNAFRGDSLNTAHNDVTSLTMLDVSRMLDVTNKNIASLEGIEYFTALTDLNCDFNSLDSLDVSKNTALTSLQCNFNNLITLDVSKNRALMTLLCLNNRLSTLDVSANTALTDLNCSSNGLTTLDVSKNTALRTLRCTGNGLTTLDVSANTVLIRLNCAGNDLATLDIRGMRSVFDFTINAGTGGTNPIARLLVHDNMKDHAEIREAKTNRGNDLTIEVYTAASGSTDYTQSCADYNPNAAVGDRCPTQP